EAAPPMIPPEDAAMRANLLAPGTRGIGWGGDPANANAAVQTLGPFLFVTGLKSDRWATTDVPPLHPLAHLLAAEGADVRVEGGQFGEGAVVDVSCAIADPAGGRRVLLVCWRASPARGGGGGRGADSGEGRLAAAVYTARPPWIGPPISD